MKPNIIDAVRALVPNAQFVSSEVGIIEWHSSETQPSQEDVDAKLKALIEDYDSKKYQRDRKYPDLGEQFDLLFKDIDSGKVSKDGGFYKAIKAVKDAHPKPSE